MDKLVLSLAIAMGTATAFFTPVNARQAVPDDPSDARSVQYGGIRARAGYSTVEA